MGSVAVPVAHEVLARHLGEVPSVDGLHQWDGEAADTAVVRGGVAVMEPEGRIIDLKVGVVALRDHECRTLLPGEVVSDGVVHHRFQRIPSFSCGMDLLGDARVVPDVAWDDEVEIRVLQEETDARDE